MSATWPPWPRTIRRLAHVQRPVWQKWQPSAKWIAELPEHAWQLAQTRKPQQQRQCLVHDSHSALREHMPARISFVRMDERAIVALDHLVVARKLDAGDRHVAPERGEALQHLGRRERHTRVQHER